LVSAIGASLPYAVAAALSPIPISAVTLILLADRRLAGGLFAVARVFSYAVVLTCVIVGSELILERTGVRAKDARVAVRFVLGTIAIGTGIWTWLCRPSETKPAAQPRWMGAVVGITPTRSAALGTALSIGPKSLVILAGGGLAIAGGRVTWFGAVLEGLVFLIVSTSTVLVPVVLCYTVGDRADDALRTLQGWMQTNTAAMTAVILILVGVLLIGSGIRSL
jgi:hypothetical protein